MSVWGKLLILRRLKSDRLAKRLSVSVSVSGKNVDIEKV